jgi:PIN domain nuclease of toxin-antitoxin system
MARQRLILDTHTFIWAVSEPHRLSATVRELISDRDVERYVSPATAYEVAQLVRRGRLSKVSLVSEFSEYTRRIRAEELTIGSRECLLAASFPQRHGDPFDRLLAAHSIIEGMPIATVDPLIRPFGALTLW